MRRIVWTEAMEHAPASVEKVVAELFRSALSVP